MIDSSRIHKFFVGRALVILVLIILALFVYLGFIIYGYIKPVTTPSITPPKIETVEPISGALSRITKKPYGIYVTPSDSPVQPEKFTGFHTGTDFETTPAEADTVVPTISICNGTVDFSGSVEGYGGVIILNCNFNSQAVTVLYGHIDLASSSLGIGDTVAVRDSISNLAPAFSACSGGERKHLHLGIHLGESVDYRGYVQNQSELSSWLDFQKINL